jgi:D-alanyl-D-alanine carboxypeptidase
MNTPTIVRVVVGLAVLSPWASAQDSAPTSRAIASVASRPIDVARLRANLEKELAAARGPDADAKFPGASLGVALDDGRSFSVVVGWNDEAKATRLSPSDYLHAGSVGKSFVAALALKLAGEGKLGLDEPLKTYLGDEPWFSRLPNAPELTLRRLMNHTGGLVRYEFDPRFDAEVAQTPDRVWKTVEQLAFVFDKEPPFAAGKGWEYSDTNYLVVGLTIEKVLGEPLFDAIRRRVHQPHDVRGIVAASGRKIPGLAQGRPGRFKLFGMGDVALDAEGRFAFDPSFEGAGGGWVGTSEGFARWMSLYARGAAFDASLKKDFVDGVAARGLGRGGRYGLGLILKKTSHGAAAGHSGFFPGYLTECYRYDDFGVTLCLMLNTSDLSMVPGSAPALLDRLAATLAGS